MHASRKATVLSIVCLAVFCILAAGSMDNGSSRSTSTDNSATPAVEPAESTKDILNKNVKFNYSWSNDGMIMTINYKIENPTEHAFKDFEITCNHFAPSGTKIDSNTRVIYEVVKAHGKKSKNGFNMGFINSQASSSNCKITDLVPID